LIFFQIKNTLKNNCYYNIKQVFIGFNSHSNEYVHDGFGRSETWVPPVWFRSRNVDLKNKNGWLH